MQIFFVNSKLQYKVLITTRCQVASKPLLITILVFLEIEKPIEVILERKVQSLPQVKSRNFSIDS